MPSWDTIGFHSIRVMALLVAGGVFYLLGRTLILPLANNVMDRANLDDHAQHPIRKIVWFGYLFAAIAVAFGIVGYTSFLSSLATIAAAGTLAIGFAMQAIIKNFVSGIFLFIERPFRIGDWIEWEGNTGIVKEINLRTTRVQTFDNELLTVPNADLTDSVVKNPVHNDQLRLKFVFGIGYEDDIGKATEIIIDEAQGREGILDDPAPSVRLTELADSYVGLQARIWIPEPKRSDFIKTRSEYVRDVKERFDEAGINIPYPQRDLSGEVEMKGLSA
jgi:small-conductance mechanosensitive channel